MRLRGNDVALMGVMGALIVAAGYIRLTPIVGAATYQFSLGSVALQITAAILGPFFGTATAFAGSFAGQYLTGQGGSFPLFVPATAGAAVTGLLVWGRMREGMALMVVIIASWYALPVGRQLWYYPYLHVAALVLCVALWPRLRSWREGTAPARTAALALFCTTGLLADHLVGSVIAAPLFNLTADMYRAVLFIYPVERLVLGAASAVVGTPVLLALERASFPIVMHAWKGRASPQREDSGT